LEMLSWKWGWIFLLAFYDWIISFVRRFLDDFLGGFGFFERKTYNVTFTLLWKCGFWYVGCQLLVK
jgi:hypothetical protein